MAEKIDGASGDDVGNDDGIAGNSGATAGTAGLLLAAAVAARAEAVAAVAAAGTPPIGDAATAPPFWRSFDSNLSIFADRKAPTVHTRTRIYIYMQAKNKID